MEHQAELKVKLSSGQEVTVGALKTRHVSQVGGSIALVLVSLGSSKDKSMEGMLQSASAPTVNAVVDILALCSSLDKSQIEDLPLGDTMLLIDAWAEVNKLEEIAPTFFALGKKIAKARLKGQQPKLG